MKDTLTSIKFIASFMKRYSFRLFIVLVFIITTTYLNVHAPKYMGEAIDKMISPMTVEIQCGEKVCEEEVDGYVVESIKYDSLVKLTDSIEAGDGIPADLRKEIEKNGDKNSKKLLDLSDKELKDKYDFLQEMKRIIEINPKATSDGFNSEQLKAIENSKVLTDEQKTAYTLTEDKMLEQLEDKGLSPLQAKVAMRDPEANLPENVYKGYEAAQKVQDPDALSDVYDLANDLTPDKSRADAAFNSFKESIWLLILSYVLLSISYFMYSFIMARTAASTVGDMRISLFHKIEELSIRFFDQTSDGELLSRFVNDMDNIANALQQSFTQAVSQFAMLVGVMYMMFKEDTTVMNIHGFEVHNVLAWLMVLFAIIAIIAALFIVSRAQKHVSVQQSKLGNLNGYVDEQLNSQKTVIAYGLHDKSNEQFDFVNEDLRKTSFKGQMYSNLIMPTLQGIGAINLAFIVFAGSMFIVSGSDAVSVGLIVAFIQYSQRFFQPLASIFSQYNLFQLGITGGSRIKEIFDVKQEVTDENSKGDIDGIDGKVHINNITFGYDPEKPVLKNVDIEVEKGEMVALVGPTGSGKTTVMNLMNRFYDINEGAILVDGTDIREVSLASLRRNVGIVLQESVIFSGTIYDNIAYGKEDATKEEVINAAKLANLHEFIESLDDGYETKVDNGASVFSTGQKQMMSIARTILTDPDLLILDEATSNVDTVTEEKIQAAMKNALENRTSFVIAHRLKTILEADKIVVLKDGEIIEQGSHSELLEVDGFYAELYKNQFVLE